MKICIFSGTSEGRELSVNLSGAGIDCEVCVATEYGEMVMPSGVGIHVHTGRMDTAQMAEYLKKPEVCAVVDATHPFAQEVSRNIREASLLAGIPCYRLLRDTKVEGAGVTGFDSIEDCICALKGISGPIFLTTGSKDLALFCADEDIRKRLTVRVLPGLESLKLCYDNGLEGNQIIAMQGPFSKEANRCVIEDRAIKCLVTKESGRRGGADTKLLAAEEAGIACYVIRAPREDDQITYDLDSLTALLTGKYAGQDVHDVNPDAQENTNASNWNGLRISLIGIGMGNPDSLTVEAEKTIQNADLIFGAERMIAPFSEGKEAYPYYLAEHILSVLDQKSRPLHAAVLLSGDTGFFSGCDKLYKAFRKLDAQVTILPGISSMAALSARFGIPYQNAEIVSLHGTDTEDAMPRLIWSALHRETTFFLTSGVKDLHELGKRLMSLSDRGEHLTAYIGYQISYPQEKLLCMKAEELESLAEEGLYAGFLVNEAPISKSVSFGWPDDAFIRGKVPMTKEEVRAVSISKLKLTETSVVYDIGCGTGSVSVEIAVLSDRIRVYAMDSEDDAVALTLANRDKLGLFNLQVTKGMAPEALESLPKATHAFIGGTRGHLTEILDALYKINPGMRIVMNAVSMESIAEMTQVLKNVSVEDLDITQVSISKAQALGSYHLMKASNPVYIYSFNFKEIS